MFDPLGMVLTSDPVVRDHPLNRGRVAWWLTLPGLAGGNTWHDLMGLNHAPISNMGAGSGWQGTTRPGGWGHLQFDGTDDYIATPLTKPANPPTIAAWIRPDVDFPAGLFDSGPSTAGTLRTTPGLAEWHAEDPAMDWRPTAGAWYRFLFAFSFGTNRRLDIYQDGVFLIGATGSTDPFFSWTTFRIGDVNSGSSGRFTGAIDDFTVWDRTLTAAEARADFDLSRAGYPGMLRRRKPRVATYLASTGASSTTGTAAATLRSVSASASGSPRTTGTVASTLRSVSASASGSPRTTGTAAPSLRSVSASASGSPITTGTGAATLKSVSASAAGSPRTTGTGAATLKSIAANGNGAASTTGTAAATLGSVSASAAGSPRTSGTGAATFRSIAAAALGSPRTTGTAAATLKSVIAAGSTTASTTGTAAATLGSVSAAAIGTPYLIFDDFFAGVVSTLKSDAALVAALGSSDAASKFSADFTPVNVALPHLTYVDVSSGTRYVSYNTLIEFGNFQVTITAAGKAQARALTFLLWDALDTADIHFPAGQLMELRHGNGYSQALRERGPGGEPVQYQQVTEFNYQISRPR